MDSGVVPVILSGGAGSRLWPLSRALHPKQFIACVDDDTLLQATVRRLAALAVRPPVVVCNDAHRFMVAEQLRTIDVEPQAVLLEPIARGTAPAIAAAAFEALARANPGEEPILLVLPADHLIRDEIAFGGAVCTAVREARAGKLVTFGVAPTRTETGYGYIRVGSPTETGGAAHVVDFVEKPAAEDAAMWMAAGGWYWNSGMFVFGATRYLQELGTHAAPIRDAVSSAHRRAAKDLVFVRLDAASLAESPAVSVDHAVMEHTSDAVVVGLDAGWSDIGSWDALSEHRESDGGRNVLLEGSRNTTVFAADRLVAAVGVTNCVIVDTPDALLVADKSATQDVRKVVERLRMQGREEYRVHRKVYRPWGAYDVVHDGDGFKIKLITVNPGQRLSLQMHLHRAEHWIVVRGTARVTRGEESFIVSENESTFIPAQIRHRLDNPGATPLELVEVQTGSYLGEDDIVRFDDVYGRTDRDQRQA